MLPNFRCGRTARMGNTGNALIFLLPHEMAYVEFLDVNQKAPLQVSHKLTTSYKATVGMRVEL